MSLRLEKTKLRSFNFPLQVRSLICLFAALILSGSHVADVAGAHAFGAPNAIHEISDLRIDADQITISKAEPFGIGSMHPDRIPVRDLGQPF